MLYFPFTYDRAFNVNVSRYLINLGTFMRNRWFSSIRKNPVKINVNLITMGNPIFFFFIDRFDIYGF